MSAPPVVVAPGRVAVVTGAASGIGLALAERFAAAGMKVVLADVEALELEAVAGRLTKQGCDVRSAVVDVSDPVAVTRLLDVTLDTYGGVHVLCNNAGVSSGMGPVWTSPQDEWNWIFGVNFWGVVYGLRTFVPELIRQDAAHIVNTSSIFGVLAGSMGPYSPSKHAVVALTENLYFQLEKDHPHVGVSLLCPGAVRTRIASASRNRPGGGPEPAEDDPSADKLAQLVNAGLEPLAVADRVVEAIARRRFYITTKSDRDAAILRRAQEITRGEGPSHPLWA